MTRARLTRRAAGLGTLGLLLGGCGRGSAARRSTVAGAYVDDGVGAGHALRDGALHRTEPSARERRRVVVVGGGVAGLSAAWRLAREGVEDVVVLELAPEAGGTSRGGRDGACPHPFGAHYLPLPRSDQRALAAFLEDAGLARGRAGDARMTCPDAVLVRDPAERVAGLGGYFEEGLWLRAGASAADEAEAQRFDAIVGEHVARSGVDGRRLFDLPVAASSSALRSLDGTSAAAWFEAQGFRSERLRWYLEYATRDDFGARLEDTSAWALLHYFTARADLRTGASAPYMTWPEGNARLVAHLAELSGVEVRPGEVAVHVDPGGAAVTVAPGRDGEATEWSADAIVVATPQFVTRRILRGDPAADARASLRYSPWLVANLHLERAPASRGFPGAWDSVIHGSESLGYVDAAHQLDRAHDPRTVWTWYLPVTDPDEAAARARMLACPFEVARDAVLDDLRFAHPDIDEVVTRVDLWRWGHGMVKPTPGALWGGGGGGTAPRERAATRVGRVSFAHSDLSALALFEEAHWQGTRAAEEALDGLGIGSESLL